jgi:hypothetical protein
MRAGADPNRANAIGQTPLVLAQTMVMQGKLAPPFVDALDPDEYPERRDDNHLVVKQQMLVQEQNTVLEKQLRERYRGTTAAKAVYGRRLSQPSAAAEWKA